MNRRSQRPSTSRPHVSHSRLEELVTTIKGGSYTEELEKMGIPRRTHQAWKAGVRPNQKNINLLLTGLGLDDCTQFDERFQEHWIDVELLATELNRKHGAIIPFAPHPLAGPADEIRDRYTAWLPQAAEQHICEMVCGIRLSDSDQQARALGSLQQSFRPEAYGLTSSIYQPPAAFLQIPDDRPSQPDVLELKRRCQRPLQVWLPSLSYATPAVFMHAELEDVCELNLNYAHSVSLAGNVFVSGEPDVLVIGPQAYLQLKRSSDFCKAYRVVDRWHPVEIRALESSRRPPTAAKTEDRYDGQYVYSNNPHSTEGMIFRQLSSAGMLHSATGHTTEQIDPINQLNCDSERRVLAFVPFALTAEALGVGRPVPFAPREHCGHPMLLLFHRKLCDEDRRVGQLLLARIRHAWTALATSAVDRREAASAVTTSEELIWSSFLGLQLIKGRAAAS